MDFIDEIINIWLIEYKVTRNLDYEVQEKDRKAVGLLLKRYKEHKKSNAEETLKDFETLFTKALAINSDEFLRRNMTLPFLNSQINKIKIIIKKEDVERQRIKPLTVNDFKKIFPDAEEIFRGWDKDDKEFMRKVETTEPMKKSEYIKKFGAEGFTEEEYRKYKQQFQT
jgi:hypothetical protein